MNYYYSDLAFYRDAGYDPLQCTDFKIELKKCDHHQIRTIYKKMLNRNISDDLLRRIPENKFTLATIIYHVQDYVLDDDTSDEEIMQPFLAPI